MAKPGFTKHPKFLRLVRLLGEPVPHVLGYLECLWATAYELAGAPIGDGLDVELAAQYPGTEGKLTQALVKVRLLDEVEGGKFAVHDLLDHAPGYVVRRAGKGEEAEVDKWCDCCGELFHSGERHARFCGLACRVKFHRTKTVTQCNEAVTHVTQCNADHSTAQHSTAQHIEGEESPSTPSCTETASPSSVPTTQATLIEEVPLLTYPTDGKAREWHLTPGQVREWSGLFPALDVLAECRKALAWVQADSRRRKTAAGMPRFLVGWLGRSQDRGPRNATGPPQRAAPAQETVAEKLARLQASGQVPRV